MEVQVQQCDAEPLPGSRSMRLMCHGRQNKTGELDSMEGSVLIWAWKGPQRTLRGQGGDLLHTRLCWPSVSMMDFKAVCAVCKSHDVTLQFLKYNLKSVFFKYRCDVAGMKLGCILQKRESGMRVHDVLNQNRTNSFVVTK